MPDIKVITHNEDDSIDVTGISRKGFLNYSFSQLEDIFGPSIKGSSREGFTRMWDMKVIDGESSYIVSIYDSCYIKDACSLKDEERRWAVGSNEKMGYLLISIYIGNKLSKPKSIGKIKNTPSNF